MIAALAPVGALLLSAAILLMGNGLQGTLLPVRAGIEGFSTVDIGVLGSSYFLGFAAGCFYGPQVVRKVGHIRTFTAMSAVASAVALGHAILLGSISWWAMRASSGFCFAVLYMVIESWLNERATNESRGTVLSVYLIINLTVITIGQMMITVGDPGGFVLFAVASILVSVAAVPVALTGAAAPAPIQTVRVRLGRLYRTSPVGFVGCLAIGLANGAFWSLGPVFAGRGGMDVSGVAMFMSVIVISGAAGQLPLGRLSDRMDRRRVVAGACLGAALTAAGMVAFHGATTHLTLAMAAAWGLFAFPIYGIVAAHTNDHAQPSEFVETSSGLLLVFGGGAVLGPIIASAVMQVLGPAALFGFTCVIHLATAGYAAWRMTRRDAAPAEDHVTFVEALQSVQTVSPTFDLETHPACDGDRETRPTAAAAGDADAPMGR